MGKSKIVFSDTVLMDLTSDTITKDKLLKGYTAHGADGEPITGTCEYDANTQDATAKESEILDGKVAYVRGAKISGKMTNHGGVNGTISTKGATYSIPQGFHDGSGKVKIADSEAAKLIPENIRDGVSILGVDGSMTGSEDVKAQSKTVTPTVNEQVVLPDPSYNALTQVTVAGIPYVETDNSAGGKTVKIG